MQLKEISFEIIQKCPNNCIYCSSNSNCNSQNIITYDVFKRTIDEACDMGLKTVCISGGEPFLHPNLVGFVRYLKEKKLEVFVYTSGISYDKEGNLSYLNKDLLNRLKRVGLDKLIFNLQSSEEELYNRIMGTESCFELLKESISTAGKAGLFTEIHFVPMKINYKMIYSVVEMAKNLGVKKVSFLRVVIQGRAKVNMKDIELSDTMNIEIKNTLGTLEEKFSGIDIRLGIPLSNDISACHAGSTKLIIRYDGAVFPCEAFKYIDVLGEQKLIKPDNINNTSLKDIYHNSEFLKILAVEINEFKKSHKCNCETCPAQYRLAESINY